MLLLAGGFGKHNASMISCIYTNCYYILSFWITKSLVRYAHLYDPGNHHTSLINMKKYLETYDILYCKFMIFLYFLHPHACDFSCNFALASIVIWSFNARLPTFLIHVKVWKHIVFICPKFYKRYAHYKMSFRDKVFTRFFVFYHIVKF